MDKLYYTIGEVSELLGETTSLVRFWSNSFPKYIKPKRNAKGNRLFIHVLSLTDSGLFVPLKNNKVKRAIEFKSGKAVKFTRVDGGIALQFAAAPTDIDYIIELNY